MLLPGDRERFERAAEWLRKSVAAVARCRPQEVKLSMFYEFDRLTLDVRVPARLDVNAETAYEHAGEIWQRWLTDNPDLATPERAALRSVRAPRATQDLSTQEFARLMKAMREKRGKVIEEAAAETDSKVTVVWDDRRGGWQEGT